VCITLPSSARLSSARSISTPRFLAGDIREIHREDRKSFKLDLQVAANIRSTVSFRSPAAYAPRLAAYGILRSKSTVSTTLAGNLAPAALPWNDSR